MDHSSEHGSTTTRRGLRAQVGTFIVIGIASTGAYVLLFGGLRAVLSAFAANAAALVITAVGNTAANRRLTFGVRDRTTVVRDQAAGLAAFGIALAITSAAVALLTVLAPRAGRPIEIAVLVGANAVATAARFVLLRAVIAPGHVSPSTTTTDRYEGTPS